jgi:hypothetical protein
MLWSYQKSSSQIQGWLIKKRRDPLADRGKKKTNQESRKPGN